MSIKLVAWHNVVVCGMRGTGKTTLEKEGLIPAFSGAGSQILVFDPGDEFKEFPQYIPKTDSPLELDRVCKALWNKGNTLLVVSEAELYLPVGKPLPPNIFKYVNRGRHRNLAMLADTRRIANLNKTVFGLSEHAFVFRHFSPTDIRYLQEFVPIDCRQLAHLQPYHFWHYTNEGIVEECAPLKVHKPRK